MNKPIFFGDYPVVEIFHVLKNRRHVNEYDTDNIPEKQVIEDLLWKSWKVTPSKNNFMPYHCNVLGPDKVEEKNKIKLISAIHKDRTDQFDSYYFHPNRSKFVDKKNPYFRHLASAPYMLVFTQRLCTPNEYYRKAKEKNGDFYDQMHEHKLDEIMSTTALEVGMWMANLSAFALEKGLNTSVIKCYPGARSSWRDFDWIKHTIVCIATIGKAKTLRRESMTEIEKEDDKKPEPEEIIKWI